MVERQHDNVDNHFQNLQWQASLSRGESSRFTFHTLEDNSKVWRFETEIEGRQSALIFHANRLQDYIKLTHENLRDRLRDARKEQKGPENIIHFYTPKELEDWLSQHPQDTSKSHLHFKNANELGKWIDQHPEYLNEPPKFHISFPTLVPLKPLTPEEMKLGKELFKKLHGADIDDFEIIVEELPQPEDNLSDHRDDIDIRFHLRGEFDLPPESH